MVLEPDAGHRRVASMALAAYLVNSAPITIRSGRMKSATAGHRALDGSGERHATARDVALHHFAL